MGKSGISNLDALLDSSWLQNYHQYFLVILILFILLMLFGLNCKKKTISTVSVCPVLTLQCLIPIRSVFSRKHSNQ